MRKGLLLLALITFMFFWAAPYAAPQSQKAVTPLPPKAASPPSPKVTAPPPSSPSKIATLTVNAPISGENWAIGSTHNITWTGANITGPLSIHLYRGGTDPLNRIGTIASSCPVSNGMQTWKVGDYIGGTAARGNDYRIVIKSDNPSIMRVSGSFNIISPTLTSKPHPEAPISGVKKISLTYPAGQTSCIKELNIGSPGNR